MNEAQIIQKATAHLEAKSTADLVAMHATLEGTQDATERRISAFISEVLIARHDLAEAIDAIYDDFEFEGSFHDALVTALAA